MQQCLWLWIILSCAAQATDEVRTWTDVQGRTMQAVFLREVDGDVSFLKDGKLTIVPLEKLSEQDQKLIRTLEANRKVVEEGRPAGAPRESATAPASSAPRSPFESSPAGSSRSEPSAKQSAMDQRVWRDVSGNQITARFVRFHDGNVILSRGGRVQSLPFTSLSREDRQYVRDLLSARGEEHLIPAVDDDQQSSPLNSSTALPPTDTQSGPPQPPSPPTFAPTPNSPFPPPTDTGAKVARGSPSQDPMLERMKKQNEQQLEEAKQRRDKQAQDLAQAGQGMAAAQRRWVQQQKEASENAVVAECGNCKKSLTNAQADLKNCPHCGVVWQYEVDRFGNKREIPGAAAAAQQQNADGLRIGSLTERQTMKLIFRVIIPAVIIIITALAGVASRR